MAPTSAPTRSESTATSAPLGVSEKMAGKHPCSDPLSPPMPRKQPHLPCRSRATLPDLYLRRAILPDTLHRRGHHKPSLYQAGKQPEPEV
ncbi:hypothetical protein C1H46_003760 [Malus baccata]|uniref:Uncharacterized protein n=1 Tax=Malus baccata TaxID=106549 RepID=A0A540NHX2_MALBA|nr:hypothetical protein C1H46_003760 [Malus baccata]